MARRLAELTYEEVAEILAAGPAVAIVPVGSVEPHGVNRHADKVTNGRDRSLPQCR